MGAEIRGGVSESGPAKRSFQERHAKLITRLTKKTGSVQRLLDIYNTKAESQDGEAATFVANQQRFGASNLDTVRTTVSEGLLSRDQYVGLTAAYLLGINSRLKACFPRDAMDNLRALNIVAAFIPAREIDSDAERAAIMEGLRFPAETTHVTTKQAFQHFRQFVPYYKENTGLDPSVYEKYTARITDYIAESVRRAHAEQNPDLLEQVVPMMRILAYLHKAAEKVHYSCEN